MDNVGKNKTNALKQKQHKKKKKKKSIGKLLCILFLMLFILAGLLFLNFNTYGYVRESITIEAGTIEQIYPSDVLYKDTNRFKWITDINSIDLNKVGNYVVEIEVRNIKKTVEVYVVDTRAPLGETVKDISLWNGEEIEATEFITEVTDATDVNIYYKDEPDFSKVGDCEVVIVLEDEEGNKTEYTCKYTMGDDREPPVIEGMKYQTLYIGDTISYKSLITVTDNIDTDPEIEIDSSDVNQMDAGVYTVRYIVRDMAGNESTYEIELTVEEKPADIDEMNELADAVLANITTPGMTKREVAHAIYKWMKNSSGIAYIGTSDKSDWVKEATRGLKHYGGDCFTYFAVSKALLTRAGIDNMDIEKYPYRTNKHYWSLINCGDGWYHFDTTPRHDKSEFFMLTDEQLDTYSAKHYNSHAYDRTNYPATPEN